jgi:hypothetical protein
LIREKSFNPLHRGVDNCRFAIDDFLIAYPIVNLKSIIVNRNIPFIGIAYPIVNQKFLSIEVGAFKQFEIATSF